MALFGFGRSSIPFDMFDLPRDAEAARRAAKLASLYHRGQELVWDGREVLRSLLARHGGIQIEPSKREALGKIFGIIMWGELAAWKISVQLADAIVPLEPKLAATSQAHDEARHFYVMYDYLSALGEVPKGMDRASRKVLDLVLETPSLTKKLLGMQLMVESLALTIFQVVREARLEPVLSDLLRYYEKDEARHVGLGVQLLPEMIRGLSRAEALSLFVFQLEILAWSIAGLKSMEPALGALGLDVREILRLGRAKQVLAFQELWAQLGIKGPPRSRQTVIRAINAVSAALFRGPDDPRGPLAVLRALRDGYGADLDEGLPATALDPSDSPKVIKIPRA